MCQQSTDAGLWAPHSREAFQLFSCLSLAAGGVQVASVALRTLGVVTPYPSVLGFEGLSTNSWPC